MGWISSPLVGLRQGMESNWQAHRYARIRNSFRPEQEKVANQLKDWGNQDWEEWKKTFAPAEEAAAARATEGFKPQSERVTGQANVENARDLSTTRQGLDSGLSRRGVNPASGTALATRSDLANSGAANIGVGINRARTAEENRVNDANWNNRLAMTSIGSRNLGDQAQMLARASDVMATGERRAAGLSDSYSNQATDALRGAGRGIGNAYNRLRDYNTSRDINNTVDEYSQTPAADWENSGVDSGGDYNAYNDAGYREGGLIRGPGTGTSDSIPANIDGRAPARVSNGEYRIPAVVVTHVGRKKLDAIVAKYHKQAGK